jgi:acyl-CoA thioesterase I
MASIIMGRKIVAITLAGLVIGCGSRESKSAPGQSGAGRQPGPETEPAAAVDSRPVVLFFGTSLTAGLGLPPEQAYPSLIQRKLDAAGLPFRSVNAGVSGETSAAGLRRIDWILRQPVAVLVLELGANDALRGLELQAAKKNLQEIIDHARGKYPDVKVVVAGMQAPPNLGSRYTGEFRQMFVDLARENRAALIPFLLEGVGGVDSLNQPDGIHPNFAGEKIVAENVWRTLEPLLSTK